MNGILTLVGKSATRPKEAASQLLALHLGRDAALSVVLLAVIATVLVLFALSAGQPVPLVPGLDPMGPWIAALFLTSSTVVMGYAIHFTGQAMGGDGTLPGAMVLVGWLQVLQMAAIVVQSVLIAVSPGFGGLVGLAVTVGLIWVLLSFIDELHGFGSLGRAALLLLFVIVGIGLGITLILGLIGVGI